MRRITFFGSGMESAMGKMVTVQEAQTQLERLLEQVGHGEDVVIARDGKPVARLVPAGRSAAKRIPGVAKGQFSVPDSFFDPLPDDETAAWER